MTTTDIVPAGTYDDGLGDLTGADLAVPRMKVDHDNAVFVDGSTGEQFPKLFAIVLGMVRQRVLFHHVVEDNDVPMCKSPNFLEGFPLLEPPNARLTFPWERSGFDPQAAPRDEEGRIVLPCESCKLKDWGSHPADGKKPYCSEQMTLPILFASSLEDVQGGMRTPALITFQKSSITSTKRYLGGFKTKKIAAYTAYTEIGLTQLTRGKVKYCTPTFRLVGDTDQGEWPDFSEQYGGIRQFLVEQRPQAPDTGDDEPVAAATVVQPQQAARPTPQMPTAKPATVVQSTVVEAPVADDDELPF